MKNNDELTVKVRDNPDDIINPIEMIELFRSCFSTEYVRCFCREQLEKWSIVVELI